MRSILCSLFLMIALLPLAQAVTLSEQEERGKKIYFEGMSPRDHPLNAKIGTNNVDMPATVVPCASCHGRDGMGRPEGAVVPPNITWSHLTNPSGHQHPYGREHKSFDETSFMRTVVFGHDPSGNKLDTAMPRYDIHQDDLKDLVAYIKRLETDLDPGIKQDSIKLGTILPTSGRLGEMGLSVKAFLEAYVKDINEKGGLTGRNLELVVAETSDDRQQSMWAIHDLFRRDDIFSLLSTVSIGYEKEIAELADEHEMPVVGSQTLFPYQPESMTHVFYMQSGIVQQARAMVRYITETLQFSKPKVAVISSDLELYTPILEGIRDEANLSKWDAPLEVRVSYESFDAGAIAKQLREEQVEVVLFFERGPRFLELSKAMRSEDLLPYSFMPSALAGQATFQVSNAYTRRFYLTFPTLPVDHTKSGVEQFERLHRDYSLNFNHSTAQVAAMNAANVLVEVIKRSGSELSRERLMDSLQALNDFEPGLISEVSYNTTRRIGAMGAHVVMIDLEHGRYDPSPIWVSIER